MLIRLTGMHQCSVREALGVVVSVLRVAEPLSIALVYQVGDKQADARKEADQDSWRWMTVRHVARSAVQQQRGEGDLHIGGYRSEASRSCERDKSLKYYWRITLRAEMLLTGPNASRVSRQGRLIAITSVTNMYQKSRPQFVACSRDRRIHQPTLSST